MTLAQSSDISHLDYYNKCLTNLPAITFFLSAPKHPIAKTEWTFPNANLVMFLLLPVVSYDSWVKHKIPYLAHRALNSLYLLLQTHLINFLLLSLVKLIWPSFISSIFLSALRLFPTILISLSPVLLTEFNSSIISSKNLPLTCCSFTQIIRTSPVVCPHRTTFLISLSQHLDKGKRFMIL